MSHHCLKNTTMKKLLDILGYGFRLPFTPIVIPWFVAIGLGLIGVPVYHAFPDGYGEIPGWANVVGLIGGVVLAIGVMGSLIRGSMK